MTSISNGKPTVNEHQASRYTLVNPEPTPARSYGFDMEDSFFILRVADALGCSQDEALHGILREARALAEHDGDYTIFAEPEAAQ